ncbi:YkgJ family cysteine cluster protein [Alkaliflexus imshenetskii]|uniref:YkgJ family cysteine cluster protein n=1 Tax=Alkaliflexus imshenetskii TaxID=286730 RepID=UPI0004B5C5EE|nr:YkgJ family cysteine cluster protein [Alkaliflexus imshenetskii]
MKEKEKDDGFLQQFKSEAQNKARENKLFLEKLRKKKPADLDLTAESLHIAVFEKLDCLQCANCCKTTSPILIDRDIDRIAKRLRLRPSQLIEQFLRLDEDGDYVFREAPCPFLLPDNYCLIYEDRPRACREYPHTDRKRFHQILNLTYRNTLVCPAVLQVVDGLKKKYSNL